MRKKHEKQKGAQKGDDFYQVDCMTDPLVTICLDGCIQTCVNNSEYWCLEGVKMYHSYDACYHRGLECIAEAWAGRILSWL